MNEYAVLRMHDQRGRDRQVEAEKYRLARHVKDDRRVLQDLKKLVKDLKAVDKRLRPAY